MIPFHQLFHKKKTTLKKWETQSQMLKCYQRKLQRYPRILTELQVSGLLCTLRVITNAYNSSHTVACSPVWRPREINTAHCFLKNKIGIYFFFMANLGLCHLFVPTASCGENPTDVNFTLWPLLGIKYYFNFTCWQQKERSHWGQDCKNYWAGHVNK